MLKDLYTLLNLLFYAVSCIYALSSSDPKPNAGSGWQNEDIAFRQGVPSDELQISLTMTRNLMNPLGINSKRFLVAVNSKNDKELYGWAQLRSIGGRSSQLIRDPSVYNSLPGSKSLERDIDDEMMDDFFENDDIEMPNGFASLPWTKEYRDFAQAAAMRRQKREYLLETAEKEDMMDRNQLWELASVYVLPQYRNKGIGSELIRRIMAKHVMINERRSQDVYLLTLDSTKDWYRKFGFELTNEPPASMSLEITVGEILTKMMAVKLVAMRGGNR